MLMTVLIGVAAYLVAASVLGLIPATLAKNKGRSFAAWWGVSVLALGIFTVIPVSMLPTYRCPACKEVVRPNASICWRCHQPLVGALPTTGIVQPPTRAEAERAMRAAIALVAGTVLVVALMAWAAFESLKTPGAAGVTGGLVLYAAAIDSIVVMSARRMLIVSKR